ncbi:uncharacterized protein TrAFT101_002970 [Trichoderma asperellum]|uniref:uncharacterized protein n=1 Tax=Trichoderma asperellum TaxID=101201 RepID=UPI00333015F3|nr:hypothetical protein TrAFT101_002970 [Trichoderma asperellum]
MGQEPSLKKEEPKDEIQRAEPSKQKPGHAMEASRRWKDARAADDAARPRPRLECS